MSDVERVAEVLPASSARSSPSKRPSGGQPGNSNHLIHGRFRRRRFLKGIEWQTQLDRRSKLYADLREREAFLASGVGGKENLSPQRQALLPTAAMLWLEVDTLNDFIASRGYLIHRKRGAVRQIVVDRNREAMALKAILELIGLERVPVPVQSLEELVADRVAAKRLAAENEATS
jgi:hypothetical protein